MLGGLCKHIRLGGFGSRIAVSFQRRLPGEVRAVAGYCSGSNIKRENEPISKFPVPEKSTLPSDIQERMEEAEEKAGFIPNAIKSMAHRPEDCRAFFQLYDALMLKETGSLTKADKELIAVAISGSNKCSYCVVAHSAMHRVYSEQPYVADQVAIHLEFAKLSPRERAMVDFALDVCHMRPITEKHFEELGQHDLDREDAWDIGAIAAFFAMSNRMAHVTAMRPNEEFYTMGRIPREK